MLLLVKFDNRRKRPIPEQNQMFGLKTSLFKIQLQTWRYTVSAVLSAYYIKFVCVY